MNETVVRNFSSFSPSQLAHLRSALSLPLPDEILAFCKQHYGRVERRDPFTDELQMLGALCLSQETLPEAECIYELTTQNEELAKTYADAVQKRKLHNPDATYPPTLCELSALATKELCRTLPLPSFSHSFRIHSASDADLDGSVRIFSSHARNCLRHDAECKTGDVLLLIQPTKTELPTGAPASIKLILRVGRNGLLCTLLSRFEALSINLTAFVPSGAPTSMTHLTHEFYTDYSVACVCATDVGRLCNYLKEHGISAIPFAYLNEGASYSFLRDRNAKISIKTQFMRALFRRRRNTVSLESTDAPRAEIARTTVSPVTCAYLDTSALREREIAVLDGVACTSASATLGGACFEDALYTALTAVLSGVARGIPPTEQSLSLAVSYSSVAEALGALLGIYRVQTELCVPAREVTMEKGEETGASLLEVFSLSKALPSNGHLCSEGASIYLLEISTDENGFPDFDALRRDLSILHAAFRKGYIRASRLLVNESARDAVANMSVTYACEIFPSYEEKVLPLAILLESDERIELPTIGTTARCAEDAPVNTYNVCSPANSPIPSEQCELVVLAERGDTDAIALCQALSLRGARAQLFYTDEKSVLPLSRALLCAHVLILCRGAYPSEERHLAYATEVLLRAGGSIFALYECEKENVLSLPNGIPEQMIDTLLSNS